MTTWIEIIKEKLNISEEEWNKKTDEEKEKLHEFYEDIEAFHGGW